MEKFYLECQACGETVADFKEWFKAGQSCPRCSGKQVYVQYKDKYKSLPGLLKSKYDPSSIWHYFPYLPINHKENIVSFNEGIVDIDRWSFLEEYAARYFDVECKIYVQRFDQNRATGTFKDLAGTVAASVLKENGRKEYVGASTGNIGNAYAKYLAQAGIRFYAFIPQNSSCEQEQGVTQYGQTVYRVEGDYAVAKARATEFAKENNMILAAGNFDPMRIEAKKVMVYEWLRKLDEFPTVYIQALSGGTGPLGIQKAFIELTDLMDLGKLPRQILVQSGKCDPMAKAWSKAKEQSFPDGWEQDYPVIKNPETYIPTLATGNPQTYPVIAPFVKDTDGEIISCEESLVPVTAAWVAVETGVQAGPAATITITGILTALRKSMIRDGDVILLNLGEGVFRSAAFLKDVESAQQHIDYLKRLMTHSESNQSLPVAISE